MTLTTSKYNGTKVKDVIQSLTMDKDLMDFIRGQCLPTGDILEAIATIMVVDDPLTVNIDGNGIVTV